MASITEVVEDRIAPFAQAALDAGFYVYALKESLFNRKAGFVYVCLDKDGPYATIQVPTNKWEDVGLDVPIKPSRDYGSGVLVDYDGTVEHAIWALRKACNEPNVTVRFVAKRGQAAPVVPNYGRNAIIKWQGGAEAFHEFTPEGRD